MVSRNFPKPRGLSRCTLALALCLRSCERMMNQSVIDDRVTAMNRSARASPQSSHASAIVPTGRVSFLKIAQERTEYVEHESGGYRRTKYVRRRVIGRHAARGGGPAVGRSARATCVNALWRTRPSLGSARANYRRYAQARQQPDIRPHLPRTFTPYREHLPRTQYFSLVNILDSSSS